MTPENRVLVVKGRHSGKWSFPKGHLESFENSLDCALRELTEETGVDLTGVTPLACQKLSVGRYFIFELEQEVVPSIQDTREVEEAAWLPIECLRQMDCNVDVNRFLDRIGRC